MKKTKEKYLNSRSYGESLYILEMNQKDPILDPLLLFIRGLFAICAIWIGVCLLYKLCL